jgi:hypothetical protein
VGEAVTREEQLSAAWYEAHNAIRMYAETWMDVDTSRAVASSACAVWVQAAADGGATHAAPYANLYTCTYILMANHSMQFNRPTEADAVAMIPLNTTLLPYQLSKIYVDIWKAAQLLHWDRKTIHRVARGMSMIWPVSDSGWAPLGVRELGPLVPPLVRRAVETLEHHRCLDCAICTEAAVRWEDADRATEQWFTSRRLAKEEAACPTEER